MIQRLNITDTVVPNVKKRVTFGVTIGNETYTSEQAVPFSAFSSSITTGYQASLSSSGVTGVAFNNLHGRQNPILPGRGANAGTIYREVCWGLVISTQCALRTSERQESFVLTMGPVASVASTTLTIAATADPEVTFDTESITVSLGGITYTGTFDSFTTIAGSTKSLIGIADASNQNGVAQALVNSLNAAASGDSLPIVASIGSSANKVDIVGTFVGARDNGQVFTGTPITEAEIAAPAFSGGSAGRSMNRPTVGNPQGDFLRGQGAKAPVNIGNIKTLFTSDSVRVVGNYVRNYEVVQGANRAATNMDLAYNTDNYNYQTPSAFITPPSRRTAGLTGSADYPAPRQITSRKIK